MTWFKSDDQIAQHPKVLEIPRAKRLRTMGCWHLCGTLAARYLTDGLVTKAMLEEVGGTSADAAMLVKVGLWHAVEGGWQFHDWAAMNPLRAEVEAKREATRKRVRQYRERKAEGGV